MKKMPVPRDQRSDVKIPVGFLPDREKSGRACFRCSHIIEDFGDGPRRCTFKCRREDFKTSSPQHHQHQYKLSRNDDDGFPKDYDERRKRANFSEIQSMITQYVGKLAGQLDISIAKSSSLSMRDFVQNILKLGIRIGLTDPSLDLSSGFIQISQNKLNNSMKKVAEENENHLQHVFSQNIKYANLLMDTGTVNNFKVLHFVITNPNYPEIIWPFDNYENTNYDGSQYTTVITEVLAHLEQQGIEVVSIIADQQPSQVKGICDTIKQAKSNMIRSLIHIPCISHAANLIYEEVITLAEFKPYLEEIDDLIDFCRNEDVYQQLELLCPTLIKTRWVYLSEVLDFIEKNSEKINDIRIGNGLNPISLQIIEFAIILRPLMNFVYYSERRDCNLYEILPKIKETYDSIISTEGFLTCKESLYVYKFVLATFIARIQSLPMNVFKTTYAISLKGREYIRRTFSYMVDCKNYSNFSQNDKQENDCDDDSLQSFEFPKSEDLEEITEIEEIGKHISLREAAKHTQKLMSTQERHSQFISLRESLLKDPNLVEYEWFGDLIPIAEETIKNQLLLLDVKQPFPIILKLRKWWFDKTLPDFLSISRNEDTNIYWRRLLMDSRVKELAHICLRFASIGSSEADVERLFSIQKNMLSSTTTNIGTATLHYRCILHCTKP